MKITLIVLLLACAGFVSAGDLNAPGAKPITVRSEILRGYWAIPPFTANKGDQFYDDVMAVLHDNEQHNTDSDGFLLGFYLKSIDAFRLVLASPTAHEFAKNIADTTIGRDRKLVKQQQEKLGLNDAQLIELLGTNVKDLL